MPAWILARYPVILLDAGKFVLGGGVVLGWWAAPASAPTDLGTVAGALAFAALTWVTHNLVTPTASVPTAPPPDPAGKHEAS